ncbi:dynamin family protein [Sulfurimonas sp. SWIR-19]|uniref:dynamin family protein n=1 Tax=Sulfurimonas sp. SWIR-19 TaxID=2878390 RepID=UPI001CF592FF|nr:dynamin family protein [Sulfurimonas sp. SWIR-19]UCN00124.1 dynamin family protein [Sulfurimonas sp. SWIR-19]
MNQLIKLDKFYRSLKDITVINSALDRKRECLKNTVYAFNETVQKIKVSKNIVKQNEEMAQLLEDTINLIKKSSNSWVNNFEELLKKEKFRSDLENYFIIIIFGKVKAGKSSLGNFIAKHKLPKQKVEFFKYDEAGKKQDINKLEEIDGDSFDTNNLECTVEIQGFKLDGMAWIDTPGLGSMVKENGDLAKKYIQSADYIIYPTSSDSPLQQDEKAQLQELFRQNKKVTICITKSDEKIEDECECGSEQGCENCNEGIISKLQNKSAQNRQEQEEYVKKEIVQLISENPDAILGDIYSISTHVAAEALKIDDENLFEKSNIPKFYELITEVVRDKAEKLKSETPYNGLKSFIKNDIIGQNNQVNSINSIRQALQNLDTNISESIERFKLLQANANADLESEIERVVAEYYSKINKKNSKEMFSKIDAELNQNIAKSIQDNIEEIFSNFDTTLKSLTTSFSSEDFEIKDIYEKIEFSTNERNKKIGSGLFGTAASIGAGVLLASSPIGWAIAGTAAAGIAGDYLGGQIGEATGSSHTEEVGVGDNKDEVISHYKSVRLNYYVKYAKSLYQQMEDTFFRPLQQTSNSIASNINKFEKDLRQIL